MKKKKVKIRQSWKIHPATRVEKDPTLYDRKKEKRKLKKIIEKELKEGTKEELP